MRDSAKSDQSFPKSARLRRRPDFVRVFHQGKVAADRCLVISAIRNDLGRTRLGLVIGRRVGTAPQRNRWKRLIREAFRVANVHLPQGLDITVRPRRGAIVAPARFQGPKHPEWQTRDTIRRSLIRLCRQLDRRLPPNVALERAADKEIER